MNAVDPSAPFSTFCAAESLLQPELWRTERTISSFPYEIPDISIIKKGYLYRPGTLTKWKTSYFVLSSTGFLHCFDGAFPKNGTKLPTASANQLNGLGESDTTLTEDAQNGLNASECKTSLKYSIPLNQPRVQVQMLSGTKSNSPHAHSFEICVLPIPRSKDGFWSKLTREPVTHRWVIRAESEEDMVDWIVEIKKKIDSYVPERPPSPLFKLGDSRALSRSATQKSVVESPESLDSDGSLLDVPLEDSASIDVI